MYYNNNQKLIHIALQPKRTQNPKIKFEPSKATHEHEKRTQNIIKYGFHEKDII